MSDYLPEGVLINILRRLPIRTAVRCTSVCKSWYTLITSPHFISTHLSHAIGHKENSIIWLRNFYDKNPAKASLHRDYETFDEYANFDDDFSFVSPNNNFRINGSCNGLVCVYDSSDSHCPVIWNPCIKKRVSLPKPIYDFMTHGPFYRRAYGFGFDAVRNDYKLVRIVYLANSEILANVEIYRLSCGVWEDISHLGLQYMVCEEYEQAYVNGIVNWVGRERHDSRGYRYFVVSFDMSSEVLGRMELPHCEPKPEDSLWGLSEAKGSLFLILGVFAMCKFDLWVMKEYGVAESWSKLFSVSVCDGVLRPLCFRQNSELLLVRIESLVSYNPKSSLVSYNPKSKQVKNLGSCYTSRAYGGSFYANSYVESLVLLDRKMDSVDGDECFKGSIVNHEPTGKKQRREP